MNVATIRNLSIRELALSKPTIEVLLEIHKRVLDQVRNWDNSDHFKTYNDGYEEGYDEGGAECEASALGYWEWADNEDWYEIMVEYAEKVSAKFFVGQQVRHKNGELYVILHIPTDFKRLEYNGERYYEYFKHAQRPAGVWLRCQSEMEDGRFVPVPREVKSGE